MSARPFGLAAAAALITIGALTGCSHQSLSPTTGLADVSPAPSVATSASSPAATPSSTPTVSTPKPPSYPDSAEGYSQAALAAYGKGNATRLADLTTGASKAQLDAVHPTNTHWHYHDCQGAAGSSYCTFDNDNGDRFRIKIDNATLGAAHAITEVIIDQTTYPTVAHDYVNEFMQAWHDVNVFRMKALSSGTVTSYFTHYTPQDTWTLTEDNTPGHTHVEIKNSLGFDQTVDVENTQLSQPHAISQVCNPTCA